MADFVVTNLQDSGAGSLRDAIQSANGSPGPNTITFSPSIADGTITLQSDLPTITTQTAIVAGSSDAVGTAPTIAIDCNGNGGLVFGTGSAGSELSGLAIGGAHGNGVMLNDSSITLNNNYIGLKLDGSALANTGDGVYVSSTSSNNNIGYNPDALSDVVANVISNNGGNGISFNGSSGNTVVSNRIGTNVAGTAAMANGGNGVLVTNASNANTIGGTAYIDSNTNQQNDPTGDKGTTAPTFVTPPLGNLISGNTASGVTIDANSQNNVLNGNFIGTDATGNTALGNGGDGVTIANADNNALIGCDFVQNPFVYYNVIGGNVGNGLTVTDSNNTTVQANFLGVGANNATMVANGNDGILVNGSSQNTQVGGVIPLGNVIAGNQNNGIEVADTASDFITFNTFAGTYAFGGAAPNGNDGILITSTGGNNTVRTNVISGNGNNGLEIGGDASGVTVVPNIIGLDTRGDTGGSFGNFNDGILITGTAHDNVIGGTGAEQVSVIRQNTVSNNGNYGIEINGSAYNNVVADTAIGTDIQELIALGNANGGVYLGGTGAGNVIGTATVGNAPVPSPSADVNIISSNGGPGVIIASGTNGDAVINNWIGLNVAGQPTLPNTGGPIQNDGGYNIVYGNAATGALPVQSPTAQLEALYVGWFGRAAGADEFKTNMETVLTDTLDGSSLGTAMLDVSQSFATSPEDAPYAELAALTPPITDPTPDQIALTDRFINQTYNNLFNRSATTAEQDTWRESFFSGETPFSALVYDIAQTAGDSDVVAENSKIDAASYFTTAVGQAHFVPSLGQEQQAVSGVVDQTSELSSQAATNALVSASHTQISYDSILDPGTFITGVRADLDGTVILTGNRVTSGADTEGMIYQGPLNDASAGTAYFFDPQFADETITTATFYGPDTSIFDPGLGLGIIRAVGSYQYAESPAGVINHGMLYQGPPNGSGGTWTQIDVPGDGIDVVSGIVVSAPVEDTILHSTQGDLIVGNYDLQGPGGTLIGANGFIYNIVTQQYTLMQVNGSLDNLTSLYGIWQNGIGSTSYTIAGGTNDRDGVNVGFLEDYDSATGAFSNLTFYTGNNQPGVITHFENIAAVPGGFSLVATLDSGPAYAFVPVNPDGTFGTATWVPIDLPGSDLLTGNIAYQDTIGGIYNTSASSGGVASYLGSLDLSFVTSDGGLVMPVGSPDFAYALSVAAGVGATISGSTSAGNMLGGSIGNDTIFGTHSTSAADTIFTGGGSDSITLAANHTVQDRIELYAANGLSDIADLVPGGVAPSVSASIVDANDVPQLGWWGQATAQSGGPVSDASTNAGIGTGTSQDMSTVVNFQGDTIDISVEAFSDLLRSLGAGPQPLFGQAIFSNLVSAGGTVTVDDADVLRIDSTSGYANAAAVASALEANPITFASAQSGTFNHYIIAYQDLGGDVRIADMDIQLGSGGSFDNTAGGATLSISDMLLLSGVSLADLEEHNITFLAGGGADIVRGETRVVSSGQTSSGLIVQSGGTLQVIDGGTVVDTLVLSGGLEDVLLGGTDNGAVVGDGGVLYAEDGGRATSVTVLTGGTAAARTLGSISGAMIDGGELGALQNGVVIGATLRHGGELDVDFNGVASGTIISSGSTENVFGDEYPASGDNAFDYGATILNGGSQTLGAGAIVVGTTIGSGGVQIVGSNAVVGGAGIKGGGLEEVLGGGLVSGTVVSSGGTLELIGAAAATSVTYLAGATLEIVSRAMIGATLSRGFTVEVGTDATVTSTTVASSGQLVVSGGTASNTLVQGGGSVVVLAGGHTSGDLLVGSGSTLTARETVSAGGSALNVTLSNTGVLAVLSGGSAANVDIGSSGNLAVMSGGSATGLTVGGTATLSGGTAVSAAVMSRAAMIVLGGTDSAATVSNGGQIVLFGGTDLGVTVLNGGQEILSSGGSAGGTTVSSGGLQTVLSGATASGTTVESGGAINVFGGANISGVVSSGAQIVVSGGSDSGTTVFEAGSITVLAGGQVSASNISAGGLEIVSSAGSAIAATAVSGGQVNVLSGGTASGTLLGLGGREVVSAGGVSHDTLVGPDGLEIVSSGGQSIAAVVSRGGAFISTGGLASNMTVMAGGEFSVLKGGVASNAIVAVSGREVVSSGGTDRNATVSSGGEQVVAYGGTASGAAMAGGGLETVESGGAAVGAVLSGGTQTVMKGAIANGTVVLGGEEDVSGTANGTVVSAGGSAEMSSGGQANSLIIDTGGSATVMSGGAVSGATLSGGTLEIKSGGLVLSSTMTFSGGELVLDDTKFKGKIDNFNSTDPDSIDLTAINFATMTLGYSGNSTSGTLSVSDGTHTMKLTMIGDFTAANFQATTDGGVGTLITVSGIPGH